MIHHERLKPPIGDYPPHEWCVIEKRFRPEFTAQMETVLALGNGYLGMRGVFEEGKPCVQNGTFINGFYESWPIVYAEEAFGFARTGQTMLNVTDSKLIKVFVDDEPFDIQTSDIVGYTRQLNMKCGTLDRELVWETRSGKQILIKSRRLVSLRQRHVAAIYYEVTVRKGRAPVVISSELLLWQPAAHKEPNDPRKAKLSGMLLQPCDSEARDRRIVLTQCTTRSHMDLACGIDHDLECECPHSYKSSHTGNSGRVVFTVDAEPNRPIRLEHRL